MRLRYFTHAAEIFREVVRDHPRRTALRWTRDHATTYEQLDHSSNQVARVLLGKGVRKRDTVCICLDKVPLAYGAILGCLKIGAAYFVVDPGHPAPRTEGMLERCRPALVFAQPSAPLASFRSPTAVVGSDGVDAPWLAGVDGGPVAVPWEIDGSDPAYIMFTSGSTGAPKGVTISQSNVVNFIRWTQNHFDITPDDVLTNVNPLFFDNSVFDLYSSLFCGAALVPFTAETMRDSHAIAGRIDDLGCTIYFSVPSLLVYLERTKAVGAGSFPSLKKIIFGGEGYPKPMLRKLYEHLGQRIELHNVYGPTECTCICSAYRIGAGDLEGTQGYVPLGRLVPNFSSVIIDESNGEVRQGEVGELCLGGPCVGLGYYGAPELTAQAFVQNPTHDRFADRVYRTGDLVRCDRSDGKLYFVGRSDSQIKHQGYRIELGEIEHAMNAVDGVDEAAAIYTTTGETGRIVGVVASKENVPAGAIRTALTRVLPKYMVPDRIVVVTELTKNANGKIDRQAIAKRITLGPV
jgi:D-alanine--poly(phosphoribitol) ligase subunit 1